MGQKWGQNYFLIPIPAKKIVLTPFLPAILSISITFLISAKPVCACAISLKPINTSIIELNDKYRKSTGVIVTGSSIIISLQTYLKYPPYYSQYRIDLKTGVIRVRNILPINLPRAWNAYPNDYEKYSELIEEMLDVVTSAYKVARPWQKNMLTPVIGYFEMLKSRYSYYIPVTADWRARIEDALWNDSRGLNAVTADIANNCLILYSSLDTSVNNYAKGEIFVPVSGIYELGKDFIDMSQKKLLMEVFIPVGFVNNTKYPDCLRLFMKSGNGSIYGIWRKIDYNDEGGWVKLEFAPAANPASWKDKEFNPAQVNEFGLAITKGNGSYYGGGLKVRSIRFKDAQAFISDEPLKSQSPPVSIQDFIESSGRNLRFSEYNYGWCVGQFPVIWGQGEHGGFSSPEAKERLRNALLYLKQKGISTVRLMAMFGDLRTGILQDTQGAFLYGTNRQLQFDDFVYSDVKAFLDLLHETDMKAIICLFDFRVADNITAEGTKEAKSLVGEHPEIFTDIYARARFFNLFSRFFAKLYSPGFTEYNINEVVRFWEVMNEPEAICAVKFSQVLDFNNGFFGLIRRYAPGAKVTTSSLTIEAAFRFWRNKVDVISVHHYPEIENLSLSQPVGDYGFSGKPLYWTEFGDLNLTMPDSLENIYKAGSGGLLFWVDDRYKFSEDEYQAWIEQKTGSELFF